MIKNGGQGEGLSFSTKSLRIIDSPGHAKFH